MPNIWKEGKNYYYPCFSDCLYVWLCNCLLDSDCYDSWTKIRRVRSHAYMFEWICKRENLLEFEISSIRAFGWKIRKLRETVSWKIQKYLFLSDLNNFFFFRFSRAALRKYMNDNKYSFILYSYKYGKSDWR